MTWDQPRVPLSKVALDHSTSPRGIKDMGFVMKNLRKMMLRAGLAAMALVTAGSASAASYLVTAQGNLQNVRVDRGTFFGESRSANLEGDAFTLTFNLAEPTQGPGNVIATDGNTFLGWQSISRNGLHLTNPLLTINGVTELMLGVSTTPTNSASSGLGNNLISGLQLYDEISFSISQDFSTPSTRYSDLSFFASSTNRSIIDSINYNDPINYQFQAGDYSGGGFSLIDSEGRNTLRLMQTAFSVNSLSIETLQGPAAVPEPASWALMIAGFGLVGSAIRRRVTKVSYA
jgi:hypothetical protein